MIIRSISFFALTALITQLSGNGTHTGSPTCVFSVDAAGSTVTCP
jgi:hypothetical protein